jgi:hypothetical protein
MIQPDEPLGVGGWKLRGVPLAMAITWVAILV